MQVSLDDVVAILKNRFSEKLVEAEYTIAVQEALINELNKEIDNLKSKQTEVDILEESDIELN